MDESLTNVRQSINELSKLGRFPADNEEISNEKMSEYVSLIRGIKPPVTNEESIILCGLLGEDDFYGAAWTVLHLLETAPQWPIEEGIQEASPSWQEILRQRVANRDS